MFSFPPNTPPWPAYTVCKFVVYLSLILSLSISATDTCQKGDFFTAAFNCPHEVERHGALGDGGKWVCGLSRVAKKPDCVVYSFGKVFFLFYFLFSFLLLLVY